MIDMHILENRQDLGVGKIEKIANETGMICSNLISFMIIKITLK